MREAYTVAEIDTYGAKLRRIRRVDGTVYIALNPMAQHMGLVHLPS